MFRLPVCPHCRTVYHYRDTVKAVQKKENRCYHCEQGFRAKLFPGVLIPIVLGIGLCIATNLLLLSQMKSLTLWWLLLCTLLYFALIAVVTPFFARFGKEEKQKHKREKTADRR